MGKTKWSIEKLQDEAAKYQSRSEFQRMNEGAYSTALRLKVMDEICAHIPRQKRATISHDEIREIAKKYDNTFDFRTLDPSAYGAASRDKILADVTSHMRRKRACEHNKFTSGPSKWSLANLIAEGQKYQTIKDFRINSPKAYDAVCRQKNQKLICAHMTSKINPLTHQDYVSQLRSKNIDLIGQYGGSESRAHLSCRICAHLWDTNAWRALNETGCPRCAKGNISGAERSFTDWIESLNVAVKRGDRTVINPLEIDAFIPSHNIAVEFNGTYWHSTKEPGYHLNKTVRCAEQGVRLIHVWEHEQHNPVMRSIIAGALGKYDSVIHARKCTVEMVSWSAASAFLAVSHIQGAGAPTGTNVALRYDGEIVAVMTFAKPRFERSADWELVRYACALGTRVVGGASKLFKRRPAGSCVTYSDRRLFDGSLYSALGFVRSHDSAPGYFYVNGAGDILLRYAAQRKKLPALLGDRFDPELSEAKNMVRAGYHRVWDCGTVTWRHD